MTEIPVPKTAATALEWIDELYNLAYWMTGSEASAGMFVSQTYLNPHTLTSRAAVFKMFREQFQRGFGQNMTMNHELISQISDGDVARAVVHLPADFKMAILLADAENMSHAEISEVVGKPVDTVRSWLHWGRKLLYSELTRQGAELK
ncbi:MAG: RNA polymerase subunit sigma-24 [Rhizobacter sp.]|nr:RNA polymerase subunit sigma-24 [Chlorobiales bacterium]